MYTVTGILMSKLLLLNTNENMPTNGNSNCLLSDLNIFTASLESSHGYF